MLRVERNLDHSGPLHGKHRLAGSAASACVAGGDLIALLLAFLLMQQVPEASSGTMLAQTVACFAGLLLVGHYGTHRALAAEVRQILAVSATVLAGLLLLDAVAGWPQPGSDAVLFAVSAPALVVLARLLVKASLYHLGAWRVPAVLVGSPDRRDAVRPLIARDWYAGCAVETELDLAYALPALDAVLLRPFAADSPTHVIIAIAYDDSAAAAALVERLDHHPGLSYDLILPPSRLRLAQLSVRRIFGHDEFLLCVGRKHRHAAVIKRVLDVVLASVLILVLAPILLVVALLVKADGGPALYGSARLGRHGRPFRALKFRSMVPDAETKLARMLADDPDLRAEWERKFKLVDDPRITPVGRFLRRTSLDELPQLFNVLKGEMSLVGPRPILPEERASYGKYFANYCKVAPGITGVWQILGRDKIPYERRASLNDWYLRNMSTGVDFFILYKTAIVVFRRLGAS